MKRASIAKLIRLNSAFLIAIIIGIFIALGYPHVYSQRIAERIKETQANQSMQQPPELEVPSQTNYTLNSLYNPSSSQYSNNTQTTTGNSLGNNTLVDTQSDYFGYLDTARQDTNKAITNQTHVDTRFFQRDFLETQRPLQNEVIAIGSPYEINWKKSKYIPIDIRSFIVNIGTGESSSFKRHAKIAEVSANSRTYTPIVFTIPQNYNEGEYTLEYIGFLEPGDAIVGPQYSKKFRISHQGPSMSTRFTNAVRQRLPGNN